MTGRRKLAIAGIALAPLVFIVLMPELPDGTYRTTTYFDLSGGRMRVTKDIFGLTVSDRVQETDLSTMYHRHVGGLPAPTWRFCNALSINGMRECGHGGSIASDAWTLGRALNEDGFTDAAKRKAVMTFLDVAKRGDVERVQWYTWAVCDAFYKADLRRVLDVADIPNVPDKQPWPSADAR